MKPKFKIGDLASKEDLGYTRSIILITEITEYRIEFKVLASEPEKPALLNYFQPNSYYYRDCKILGPSHSKLVRLFYL